MNTFDEYDWLGKTSLVDGLMTPFLLMDTSIAKERVQTLKELVPRARIYYAVKSNNDPRLLDAIDEIVEGYDVASAGEYLHLRSLGVAADRIIYSNPVKIPSHIERTHKGGVTCYAVDSLPEISKLKKHAPGCTVNLRLRTPDFGSKFPLSSKFGLDAALALDYACIARNAGLAVKGLTFHVGSQSENPLSWSAAIKMCADVIDDLAKKNIMIEFIDLGGGLPAIYEDRAPNVIDAAKAINCALDEYIPSHIQVLLEPGRYVSANTSVLVASIIGQEHRAGTDWLYLDMGVFQGLIEPLEIPGWRYPILTDGLHSPTKKPYMLTGPTCDAYDTLGDNYMLPSDLKVGDRLCIGAAGAYTLVYGSTFNGFEIPKTYYVDEIVR